jgi:opacity protein-like surface antigen
MKRLTLAALAVISIAAPAMAQWNVQQMPLGGGWNSITGNGPNGQSFTGTTMPLGGGWSSTQYNDNNGHSTTCTTMPMGGGFTSTQCN